MAVKSLHCYINDFYKQLDRSTKVARALFFCVKTILDALCNLRLAQLEHPAQALRRYLSVYRRSNWSPPKVAVVEITEWGVDVQIVLG